MITIKRSKPKTYEEMMEEAFTKIPLYSNEWTNFNPSDPAVTILENLTAFNLLQINQMGNPAIEVKEKLLKLVGFEAKGTGCSRVLLEQDGATEDFYIPAGQKFLVGDLNFETNRKTHVYSGVLTDIFTVSEENVKSLNQVLDGENTLSCKLFSKKPSEKAALYMFFDKKPVSGQDAFFYFEFDENNHRTKGEENDGNDFAKITWEIYTEEGFLEVKVKDKTRAFLSSGEVRLSLPNKEAKSWSFEGREGFCIRAVFDRADYDIIPKLSGVHPFLFEVWQRETRSICHTLEKADKVEVYCDLLEENFVNIYCKEDKNSDYYRAYKEAPKEKIAGRFVNIERKGFGLFEFSFNKRKHGFGPCAGKDSIKIVAYAEEMMKQYELGTVYGYDDQEFVLPKKNVVPDNFSIIARMQSEKEDDRYYFVKPARNKEGNLYYEINEREGKLIIKDAGNFTGAILYMATCAVTEGEDGNIRAYNEFIPSGYETDITFFNPARGEGGRKREDLKSVEKRFVRDLEHPYAAVKGSDFEELVKSIPDLCIKKARAIPKDDSNDIEIVCMPYSEKKHPSLSEVYIEKIKSYLDERRILTTGIEVIEPLYVPVDVKGTIYVKKHFENVKDDIERVLNKALDYETGDQQFGEVLNFEKLFREIEDLEGVEYIFELSLFPMSRNAKLVGLDIKPSENALLVPGKFYFDVNTYA